MILKADPNMLQGTNDGPNEQTWLRNGFSMLLFHRNCSRAWHWHSAGFSFCRANLRFIFFFFFFRWLVRPGLLPWCMSGLWKRVLKVSLLKIANKRLLIQGDIFRIDNYVFLVLLTKIIGQLVCGKLFFRNVWIR